MTQPKQPIPAPIGTVEDVVAKATDLVKRLVAIEQDADIISIFTIARAHGYKSTSKFWHEENAALANTLAAYDTAQKAPKPEAVVSQKADAKLAEVVEMPAQGSCEAGPDTSQKPV